jgi:transposase-like protein
VSSSPPRQYLSLSQITRDPRCQPRCQVSQAHVLDLLEDLEAGLDEFPPLVVFDDGRRRYLLADGWHRAEAYLRHGRKAVPVEVRPGGLREARLYAASCNKDGVLRRTPQDKRRAVLLALEDADLVAGWSAERIAAHCGVSPPTVRAIQKKLLRGEDAPEEEEEDEDEEGPPQEAREDRERWLAQAMRGLRRLERICGSLGLTVEQLLAEYRESLLKGKGEGASPPSA